jgi:hypothetical protein
MAMFSPFGNMKGATLGKAEEGDKSAPGNAVSDKAGAKAAEPDELAALKAQLAGIQSKLDKLSGDGS